jgi:hypothetical protein
MKRALCVRPAPGGSCGGQFNVSLYYADRPDISVSYTVHPRWARDDITLRHFVRCARASFDLRAEARA